LDEFHILLNENGGIALRSALALGKLRNGLMLAGSRLAKEYRAVNRLKEFQTRGGTRWAD